MKRLYILLLVICLALLTSLGVNSAWSINPLPEPPSKEVSQKNISNNVVLNKSDVKNSSNSLNLKKSTHPKVKIMSFHFYNGNVWGGVFSAPLK